ncbi:MAG: hypothetical protein AAFU85_29155 [Planctomycetota bacterium]
MSGASAHFLLPRPFPLADSVSVFLLLKTHCTEVAETRRGRHWDFTDGRPRGSLDVYETSDRDDLHEELREAGRTEEDAPEMLVILHPMKSDRDSCARLAAILSKRLSGFALRITPE